MKQSYLSIKGLCSKYIIHSHAMYLMISKQLAQYHKLLAGDNIMVFDWRVSMMAN